jgi:predicted PurR-regulated permease PerM
MYRQGVIDLLPLRKRGRADVVLHACREVLQGWLFGKICSMASLGILSFFGLVLLEVRLALTVAVITAGLAFIPNIGAILSLIPPVLLALADDPWKALYVLIFYIALQNVEGVIITPMIQRKTASLPPAILMATQLFMAMFFGLFGLFLAEPLAAVGIVLVRMLYVEDISGKATAVPTDDSESKPSTSAVTQGHDSCTSK